jgi:surfactin synthase thioesterase subunit
LRAHDALFTLIVRGLYADVMMSELYLSTAVVDVPMVSLSGTRDAAVPPHVVDGWRAHTSQTWSRRTVDGDHFFPLTQREETISVFVDVARAYCSTDQVP